MPPPPAAAAPASPSDAARTGFHTSISGCSVCTPKTTGAGSMTLPSRILAILKPAYRCPEFDGVCSTMRWDPQQGHVPRGFVGAAGDPSEVELVLVTAEPGDPHREEKHTGLESALGYATQVLRDGRDLYHRNLRSIIDCCWPGMSFEHQQRKFWLTDSVLCSAISEGGRVDRQIALTCGRRYLLAQLKLFEHALVVALGRKAQNRLGLLGVSNFLPIGSVAPPGCNYPAVRQTWCQIPLELQRRSSVN